jgi:hypothetical protein
MRVPLGVIEEDNQFADSVCRNAPFCSSVVYLRCNQKAESFLISDREELKLRLPKAAAKKSTSTTTRTATVRKSATSSDGWIDTSNKKKKAPAAAKRKRTVRKKQPAARKKKAPAKKTAKASSRRKSAPAALAPRITNNAAPDIIELDDDSSLSEVCVDDDEVQEIPVRKASIRPPPRRKLLEACSRSAPNADVEDPLWDDDSDDENEF